MALEPGTRSRTTIEKEVLPAATHTGAIPAEFYSRDFWEIISDIGRSKLWNDHLVRVYRADDRWDRAGSPENNKLTDNFNEETIRKNWGGGRYLLWLYGPPGGSKLVASPFKLELEGAPRGITRMDGAGVNGDQTPLMMVLQELLNEMRASRGGSLTQNAMKNALEIQFQAMKQSLDMMRITVPPPGVPGQASLGDDLLKTLLAALIPALVTKFTNPGSPIDDFTKIAEAAKQLVNMLGTGKGEKPDTLGTVVNALPGVLDKAVAGLREVRLANEASERAARIQQGRILEVQPSAPPPAADQPVAERPAAVPAAPPSQELTPEQLKEIEDAVFLKRIMEKICTAIETDPQCSGESLYDFLQNAAPEIIPQLRAGTREQIIEFFRKDGILSRVANHPKLPQIIDEFLAIAKQGD